jgi:hypothetical protein
MQFQEKIAKRSASENPLQKGNVSARCQYNSVEPS